MANTSPPSGLTTLTTITKSRAPTSHSSYNISATRWQRWWNRKPAIKLLWWWQKTAFILCSVCRPTFYESSVAAQDASSGSSPIAALRHSITSIWAMTSPSSKLPLQMLPLIISTYADFEQVYAKSDVSPGRSSRYYLWVRVLRSNIKESRHRKRGHCPSQHCRETGGPILQLLSRAISTFAADEHPSETWFSLVHCCCASIRGKNIVPSSVGSTYVQDPLRNRERTLGVFMDIVDTFRRKCQMHFPAEYFTSFGLDSPTNQIPVSCLISYTK